MSAHLTATRDAAADQHLLFPAARLVLVCRYCRLEKPLEAFEVCRVVGEKVYRRRKCQKCKQAAQACRRANIKRWVEDYKKARPCVRCGFTDYRALEFHHRGGEEKDFNVGDMVRLGLSIAAIQAEIEKCEVLCANCHRIEHHRE